MSLQGKKVDLENVMTIYNNYQFITLRAMPITEGDDHNPEALHKMVLASYMNLRQ